MEILRELQLLRVTREVQAVISKGGPNGGAVGASTLHPASQELQTIENLMKHNDRSGAKAMLLFETLTHLGKGPHLRCYVDLTHLLLSSWSKAPVW